MKNPWAKPTYIPRPLLTEAQTPKIPTHCDCGAELYHGDCPACDPWPEDDFDDDFDN